MMTADTEDQAKPEAADPSEEVIDVVEHDEHDHQVPENRTPPPPESSPPTLHSPLLEAYNARLTSDADYAR